MSDEKISNMEDVLKTHIGYDMEIGIVQHGESTLRLTMGRLVEISETVIHMKLAAKPHFWSRREENADYYLNRQACTLLSVVVYGRE